MKIKTFFLTLLLGFFLTMNANAFTVNLYLDGVEESGLLLSGFQFSLINDATYAYPVDFEDLGGFPPETKEDFIVTPGTAWLFPGYWFMETLIQVESPTKDLARGVFAFSTLDNVANILDDGLLLTLTSQETNFAIDTDSFLFSVYGDEPNLNEYRTLGDEEFDTIVSFLDDGSVINVTVDFNPVPVPSSILLLGGGLCALLGLTRRKS